MAAPSLPAEPSAGFTPEQKQYLEGFLAGLAALPYAGHASDGKLTADPAAGGANLAAPPAEDSVFGTPLADLSKPERWKHEENPLDIWEKIVAHAEADRFPDEADTFRFKYHGLFYVAPAQDSFMLRLRLPAGEIAAHQLDGLAEVADWGGGYSHVTTRANLQLREFKARDCARVLVRLQELGVASRGAGADNIRNITASPNCGFDPEELIDVRPFAKGLHHYILNHRDLYGLPRKFNIAFDNGGSLSAAADTNDLAFMACRVTEASLARAAGAPRVDPGVYFRVQLGGISGHGDFARDCGLLIRPSECVAAAAALTRVFNEHGDRADRKKARLKYLLGKWGRDKYLDEAQKKLAFPLVRLPLEACEAPPTHRKHGWIGIRPQSQKGLSSVGVGLPVGRMNARQMRHVAHLATNYGRGEIRLTVWQSLIIPHVPDAFANTVARSLKMSGFSTEAHAATGGIVACTGNRGCKYAATDTKGHALALAKHLEKRVSLDSPVNIHLTGCPHSCAQHYCGDLGFLGAKRPDGSEAYHVVIGGGMGHEQGIGRELLRGLLAEEVPATVERILGAYSARRQGGESFVSWARRHPLKDLQEMISE